MTITAQPLADQLEKSPYATRYSVIVSLMPSDVAAIGVKILDAVVQATAGPQRLVFVSGVDWRVIDTVFGSLSVAHDWDVVDVGQQLCERLVGVPKDLLAIRAPKVLDDLCSQTASPVMLLRRLEFCFLRELQMDPVRQLSTLARNRTIIAHWPGDHVPPLPGQITGSLTYAEPTHAEWHTAPAPTTGLVTLRPASGAWMVRHDAAAME